MGVGNREMALWVECFLNKQEEVVLDPQCLYKEKDWCVPVYTCNSTTGMGVKTGKARTVRLSSRPV